MYYTSDVGLSASAAPSTGRVPTGLPMTPSVALRALYDQILSFLASADRTGAHDLYNHFDGPIEPPHSAKNRPTGDAVCDLVANYASKIVGRSGLLASLSTSDRSKLFEEHGRLNREMFAIEHALAIDLARSHSEMALRERESVTRATLAVAAYWYDRSALEGVGLATGHPLLGTPPNDPIGRVLYDFAQASFGFPGSRFAATQTVDLRVIEPDVPMSRWPSQLSQ